MPRRDLATKWHVALLRGTHVPEAEYRGGFRGDSRRPKLQNYEVGVVTGVGRLLGAPARAVSREVTKFIRELKILLGTCDLRFVPGRVLTSAEQLEVLEIAAWAHGEWIRIHPFANGNGRTARLWAVYVCARYGLESFLAVRPRPQHPDFAAAAAASMAGDHLPMTMVFVDLLADHRSRHLSPDIGDRRAIVSTGSASRSTQPLTNAAAEGRPRPRQHRSRTVPGQPSRKTAA